MEENKVEVQETAQVKDKKNNTIENTLSVLADIVLVLGVIGAIICFFSLSTIKVGFHNEFNPVGFGISVSALLSTLISWSIMKALANISLTLKSIRRKMNAQAGETGEDTEAEMRPKSLWEMIGEPQPQAPESSQNA